ncbi:unnamed protein product [Amoebophrya sp. A120]|nr:unnamed protein product [Amoebophrya sp. A120]|eukprot:GSA120T00020820001.1
MPFFSELTLNIDSALNILPSDLFSSRVYYVTARYPTEPAEQPARRQPAQGQKGNPGAGRCSDCVFHCQIQMPSDAAQTVVLVSLWEEDLQKGDVLVGEATVPLDDPRALDQTNPWPLQCTAADSSPKQSKTPPLLTLHVVSDLRRKGSTNLQRKDPPPDGPLPGAAEAALG